jgi:TonB family protein
VQVSSDAVVVNVRLELGTLSESVTVRGPAGARSMPQIPANPRTADEFLEAARAYYTRGRFSESAAMIERAMELLRPGMQATPQSGRSTVAPVAVAGGTERVGGNVREPVKVRDVRPIYPPTAAAAGATGSVIMEAVLDRSGMVRDVRVLKSAPMLDEAATTAVRQWLYRPAQLNGVPVDVGMFVTITFGG